jgi:hypothetical protein
MTNFDHKSADLPRMAKDQPTAPACPHCGIVMKHVRTLPRLGGLPEIEIFYCASCVHAETVTLKRAA